MAETTELAPEVKTFIVQQLAMYDSPSDVARAVKEEFGLDVTRQRVHAYDPTKCAGAGVAAELKAIFEATRKVFLEETATIGIANKAYRLRKLTRIIERTEAAANPNPVLIMQALEMAAKEAGGQFTNRTHVDARHDVSDALADLMKAIDGKTRGLPVVARKDPENVDP